MAEVEARLRDLDKRIDELRSKEFLKALQGIERLGDDSRAIEERIKALDARIKKLEPPAGENNPEQP
jgi:hypothetical protein